MVHVYFVKMHVVESCTERFQLIIVTTSQNGVHRTGRQLTQSKPERQIFSLECPVYTFIFGYDVMSGLSDSKTNTFG